MADDWIQAEPGSRALVGELRRLGRRNLRHPMPVLVVTLVTTSAGLLYGLQWQPSYEARIALRLTEHDVGVAAAPRPIAALRAFIEDVALSDRVLERIIQRFNLYPNQLMRGLDQALEALRDDIQVEVWRNEFLIEAADDLGRSARVALSYRHHHPEVAWGVVEAMAEATVAEQRRVRKAQVEYLAMGLEPALAALEQRIAEVKRQLVQLAGPAAGQEATVVATKRTQLLRDLEEMEAQRRDLNMQLQEALMRLRAETLNVGLRAEIIDSIRPHASPYHRLVPLLGAVVGLVVGLLLGGVTLKAFDRRIHDEEDVWRMGLPVCGALPAYPGDSVGSMDNRVRMPAR
ncbi:MAG: hypothetical protein RMK29_16485 [Myxococcales bacterium]|nr:hypothetical protein [Myxococcales bacterium]